MGDYLAAMGERPFLTKPNCYERTFNEQSSGFVVDMPRRVKKAVNHAGGIAFHVILKCAFVIAVSLIMVGGRA